MSQKIKIALIGRPNVGKSALFNRIIGQRRAIVDEKEGVTRDRNIASFEFQGKPYELIDTGGIGSLEEDPFKKAIEEQARLAIKEADVLIMVVDVTLGVTALDEKVAQILHGSKKPRVLAINKVDSPEREEGLNVFYSLGFDKMVTVSAGHGIHIYELLENATSFSLEKETIEETPLLPKVAIIGRPNVGKSTLVNALVKEARCIVSPIAGTTRDAIEVPFEDLLFVDTAGIGRKNKERECVDKFASIRTLATIKNSDLCVLVLDSTQGMTHRDKELFSDVLKEGKPCLIVFNKWDLAKGIRQEHAYKAFLHENPYIAFAQVLFISAKEKRNVEIVRDKIEHLLQEQKTRIQTSLVNKFLEKALQNFPPPLILGKRLRVYYGAQIQDSPPTFLLFINNKKFLPITYEKYILNQLRKEFGFSSIPVRFVFKSKFIVSKEAKEA